MMKEVLPQDFKRSSQSAACDDLVDHIGTPLKIRSGDAIRFFGRNLAGFQQRIFVPLRTYTEAALFLCNLGKAHSTLKISQ